jgi:hypothetical protein
MESCSSDYLLSDKDRRYPQEERKYDGFRSVGESPVEHREGNVTRRQSEHRQNRFHEIETMKLYDLKETKIHYER